MAALKQYEAKLDAKRRVMLRVEISQKEYLVTHRKDGSIVLTPLIMTKETPAQRKARFDEVISEAKAKGEKIPAGVELISFRNPSAGEVARAKKLAPRARELRGAGRVA